MHGSNATQTSFHQAVSPQAIMTGDNDSLEVISVGAITNFIRVQVNKGHDGSNTTTYFLCKASKFISRLENGDIKAINTPEDWKQQFFAAIKVYLNNHVREKTYFEAMHIVAPNPS